ncbi:hypothetical protein WDU94_012514 [Cyamophila willieti]
MFSMNWGFDNKHCKKQRPPAYKMLCNQIFKPQPGCGQCRCKKQPVSFLKMRRKVKPCKRSRNVCTARRRNRIEDNTIHPSWDTVDKWYEENRLEFPPSWDTIDRWHDANHHDLPMKKYPSADSLNSLTEYGSFSIFDVTKQVPTHYRGPKPHRTLSFDDTYSDLHWSGNHIENIPPQIETASNASYDRCYCRYCLNLTPTQPVHCRYYKPLVLPNQLPNFQIHPQNQTPCHLNNNMQNFFHSFGNNQTNRPIEMTGNNNLHESLAMDNSNGSNNNRNYPATPPGMNNFSLQNHPNWQGNGTWQFVPPYMNPNVGTNQNGLCDPNNFAPNVNPDRQNIVNPNFPFAYENALPPGYGQNWQLGKPNDSIDQNKQLNQPKVASKSSTLKNKEKQSDNKESKRIIVGKRLHNSDPTRNTLSKKNTRNEKSSSDSDSSKPRHDESVSSDDSDGTENSEELDESDGNNKGNHQLIKACKDGNEDVTSNLSKLSLMRTLKNQCQGKNMLKLKIVKLPKTEMNDKGKPRIKLIMR